MFQKEKIGKIITFYHRYNWVIHIPFVIYFAFSLYGIGHLKMELELIKEEIEKDTHQKEEWVKTIYEDQVEIAMFKNRKVELIKAFEIPLKNQLNSDKNDKDIWLEQIETTKQDLQNILEHDLDLSMDKPFLINWAMQYPSIRSYLNGKCAMEITDIAFNSMRPSSSCYFCSWLHPFVQKYGDHYFLYPSEFNTCGDNYYKIKVNNVEIENDAYVFHPNRRGIHYLDIEYSYLNVNHIKSIKTTKELLVE